MRRSNVYTLIGFQRYQEGKYWVLLSEAFFNVLVRDEFYLRCELKTL